MNCMSHCPTHCDKNSMNPSGKIHRTVCRRDWVGGNDKPSSVHLGIVVVLRSPNCHFLIANGVQRDCGQTGSYKADMAGQGLAAGKP